MPKPDIVVKKPDKVKIQAFLQANGHKKADLDKKKWNTDKDIKLSLCQLMGVPPEIYRASGGTI